jgi:hypothetical protein
VGFKVIADIVTIATIANLAPFDSSARGWSIPNILFCFQKECDLNKRYIYTVSENAAKITQEVKWQAGSWGSRRLVAWPLGVSGSTC